MKALEFFLILHQFLYRNLLKFIQVSGKELEVAA